MEGVDSLSRIGYTLVHKFRKVCPARITADPVVSRGLLRLRSGRAVRVLVREYGVYRSREREKFKKPGQAGKSASQLISEHVCMAASLYWPASCCYVCVYRVHCKPPLVQVPCRSVFALPQTVARCVLSLYFCLFTAVDVCVSFHLQITTHTRTEAVVRPGFVRHLCRT